MISVHEKTLGWLIDLPRGEYWGMATEVPTAHFTMQGVLPRRDVD